MKVIFEKQFTEKDEDKFVEGFNDACAEAGITVDDGECACPWCAPWFYEDEIDYKAETPYEQGREWFEMNRKELEELQPVDGDTFRIMQALGDVATEADAQKFVATAEELGYEVVVDDDSVDLVKDDEIADETIWQEIMEKAFN